MNKATSILIALTLGIAQTAWAQDRPMRVSQHQQGFTITDEVDGREVIVGHIDRGTYQEALQHNPVFREWIAAPDQAPSLSPQAPLLSPQGGMTGPDQAPSYPPPKGRNSIRMASSPPGGIRGGLGGGSPLLSDSWGQTEPYNLLCPMADTLRCKVGCVATAMSQVMYYYRHPQRGNGIHTYTDTAGIGQTLTADFGAHQYEWNYMLDVYSPGLYTTRQANAVARLCSDAGIAVDMRYGVEESGALSVKQPMTLTTYFGYDRGIRQIFRDFYSQSELYTMLIAEIEAGRPILCSGYGIDGGGHAFVIDGYDGAGLFHINWGWNGYADGYYNIDYMNPHQPEWNHFRDRRELGANILQSYTIGIQPADRVLQPHETHEYAFSHLTLLDTTENNATIIVHNLSNVGWNTHDGTVALALSPIDSATPIAILHTYTHTFPLEEITDSTFTDTITIDTRLTSLSPQTCRLVPVYQEPDGTWSEARTCRGTPNHLLAHIAPGGHTTYTTPSSATAHLRLDDYEVPDTMERWHSPQMTLTITNDSPAEYCGRVYIASQLGDPVVMYNAIAGVGLYLQPGQTETLSFNYSPLRSTADSIRLCALYDVDLFTDSIRLLPLEKDIVIVDRTTGISQQPTTVASAPAAATAYDPEGRPHNPAIPLPNHIIITQDGKKRSIQNVP